MRDASHGTRSSHAMHARMRRLQFKLPSLTQRGHLIDSSAPFFFKQLGVMVSPTSCTPTIYELIVSGDLLALPSTPTNDEDTNNNSHSHSHSLNAYLPLLASFVTATADSHHNNNSSATDESRTNDTVMAHILLLISSLPKVCYTYLRKRQRKIKKNQKRKKPRKKLKKFNSKRKRKKIKIIYCILFIILFIKYIFYITVYLLYRLYNYPCFIPFMFYLL